MNTKPLEIHTKGVIMGKFLSLVTLKDRGTMRVQEILVHFDQGLELRVVVTKIL